MNAARRNHPELGHVEAYLDAARAQDPSEMETERAQRRLMDRLEGANGRTVVAGTRNRWAFAAAAAVLAVVATTLVPFIPGGRDGVAFADVQRRFETFETMHVAMTTEVGGQSVLSTRLVMDDEGRTRLDAGESFSYVIDPRAGVMLQLFHQPRAAMKLDLGNGGAVPEEARLGWLEDIRAFEGQAERLPEGRSIDGRRVTGFRLEAGGMDIVLWATADGEPVRLEMSSGEAGQSPARTRMDFRFDRPVAPGRFDLNPPAGYRLLDRPSDPS